MNWVWASASCEGTSHVRSGTRGQDASHCVAIGDVLVAVVSDGAGSAPYGGEGAAIVCRSLIDQARAHLKASSLLPTAEAVRCWIDAIRDRISQAASNRSVHAREFAATMVAVLLGPDGGLILHIGDGAAVLRTEEGWVAGSWPAAGEYASTTFFVTDSPEPRLRITQIADGVDAVAIFTDGIERLVLDFAAGRPHDPFFDRVIEPVAASAKLGRDKALSGALQRYLDSEAVNARTDDDKTLVLAVRK